MEDLVTLVIVGTFVALLALDGLRPARPLPEVRRWRLQGIGCFLAFSVVSTALPLVWGAALARHALFDGRGLGTLAGAIIGILVLDLVLFAWHVALHHVSVLWRWFHQVHHSAERIDTAGAFFFSPLDMLGFTFVTSLALVWILGVNAEAAMIANGVLSVLAVFQHANLRTPRWLGYLIQRPEGHTLHHRREVHGLNYGSLALWDMIFGTWRNPREHRGETGFYPGASRQLGRMLRGHDLVAEHEAAAQTGRWTPSIAARMRAQRQLPAAQLWR